MFLIFVLLGTGIGVFMIRRFLDIIASGVGLAMLSPLFGLIALAIKLDDPGPAFFRQERAGKDGRVFRIFKFRTMVVDETRTNRDVIIPEEDPRITRVGSFLRKTSLDELPQLINIFMGEMSLVGPRPTLPVQVEGYDSWQRRRLLVKPGITGWAQIHGRNALTWPERIELDIWYVENRSFRLDLKILLETFFVVLNRQGIYRQASESPPAGDAVQQREDG